MPKQMLDVISVLLCFGGQNPRGIQLLYVPVLLYFQVTFLHNAWNLSADNCEVAN